jgi:hypothetical protein
MEIYTENNKYHIYFGDLVALTIKGYDGAGHKKRLLEAGGKEFTFKSWPGVLFTVDTLDELDLLLVSLYDRGLVDHCPIGQFRREKAKFINLKEGHSIMPYFLNFGKDKPKP